MQEYESKIEGVVIKPLRRIPDVRGTIMHGVRSDNIMNDFGEVYFKKLYSNIINGWHIHESLKLNYMCVYGMMRVVLFDSRKDSSTSGQIQEVCMGDDNYVLVHIPPGIANASQVIRGEMAILCNVASEPHNPNLKYRRIDPDSGEIAFDWDKRNF